MRSRVTFASYGALVALGFALTAMPAAGQAPKAERFVEPVRALARRLDAAARPVVILGAGPDERQRGMWATPWLTPAVPGSVSDPPQANLWYEAATLHAFLVVSELLDDGRPRIAVQDYVKDYLTYAPSKQSGLLAWGPELSIALADGAVVRRAAAGEPAGHVLLAQTPPWDILWEANPEATAKAIAGLDYHFVSTSGVKYSLRAAYPEATRPAAGSGGCELAGLFAQSFAFLHQKSADKTSDKKWLERAKVCVDTAWAKRDPISNLVPDDLWLAPAEPAAEGDAAQPPAEPVLATSRQALLGYFLLKAWREAPEEIAWATRGVTIIKAYDQYAFERGAGGWRATVRIDGQPSTTPSTHLALWQETPGQLTVPQWGRIAAYAAQTTQDKGCLDIARRAFALCQRTSRPANVSAVVLAHTLHLALDLHELTQDRAFLDAATRLGDQGLRTADDALRPGDRPGPPQYSAGAGYLAAALLRLHLRLHKFPPAKSYDWSF